MSFSLNSSLPSTMLVTGVLNHSLNSFCDWKTLGMRKCISDHSSIMLFCSGVPVSRRRRSVRKFNNTWGTRTTKSEHSSRSRQSN